MLLVIIECNFVIGIIRMDIITIIYKHNMFINNNTFNG